MKKAQTAVIVLLILILIAIGFLILTQISPQITGNVISIGNREEGSGKVVSKTYALSDFKEIEVLGKGDLFITQQEDYHVRISAEDNILGLLNPRVEGDKLIIGEKRLLFKNTKPINIYVKLPDIEKAHIAGSGNIKSQNKIRGNKLEINIDGSSDVDMNLDVNELATKIAGSGNIFYKGEANSHSISIAGSGDIDSFELITQKTKIGISGSGNIETYAEKELDIRISGSGTVYYDGDAKVSQSISGLGKVIEK